MKALLCLGLSWLLAASCLAQAYFNNRYTLNPTRSSGMNVLTAAGGYWVNGVCPNPQSLAVFLQFVDSTGTLQGPLKLWGRLTHSYYVGAANCFMRTRDGGMALAGTGQDGTVQEGMLWRFTAAGDTLWTRRYGVGYSVLFNNACQTTDGGFALVGTARTAVNQPLDVILVRTDSTGQELWRRTYRPDWRNIGGYIVQTPDGGFLITGSSGPVPQFPPYPAQGLVLKVAADGRQQWLRSFGGPYLDGANHALPTADGGYVVSGSWTEVFPWADDQSRVVLLWYDSTGTLLRRRSYGPILPNTAPWVMHEPPTGGYVLAGNMLDTTSRTPAGGGAMRSFVLRVCEDGDSVWYRTHAFLTGPYSDNYLADLKPTADGGFVATGFLMPRPPDTGVQGTWVLRMDQYGYLQPGGGTPTVTCRPTGMEEAAVVAREPMEVFPNPSADGRFTIQLAPGMPPERLEVVDALGRIVRSERVAGREGVLLDLSREPPGLYLLRVT